MLSLHDYQHAFAADIWGKATTVSTDPLLPHAALTIYRNNVLSNYTTALGLSYPIVKKLVGEKNFNLLTRTYIKHYFSLSGDLNEYGDEFASFLSAYTDFDSYVAEVARLEWLYERTFHGPDHVPLSLEELAKVPSESLTELRFKLHPNCHLFLSDYPVHQIWAAYQVKNVAIQTPSLIPALLPEGEGFYLPPWDKCTNPSPFGRGVGGEGQCLEQVEQLIENNTLQKIAPSKTYLLLYRQGFEVVIEPLPLAEYLFLETLSQAEPLYIAYERAQAAQSDFDLSGVLHYRIQQQHLVSFYL